MTNTIKTVEELRANIKANNCVARDIELEVTHSKLVEVFTKLLTRATKEVIRDYIESECFAENDFNYITTSAVKYRQTLKSEIIKVLAWKLANKVMDMREQEVKKPVNMVIETTDDLRNALDSATTIEQVSELLHALKVSFLRLYIKEEGYDYGKPLNKVTKIEMIDTLMRVYSDRLEENEKPEAEAEPTLEELEQETGFTFCRRLGQEFLSGEVSLEQLNDQIESLERSMKYGDSDGSLHGLAYAFGIAIKNKNCEELLSEIKDFIANYDAGNGNIEAKAIANNLREIPYAEKVEKLNQAFSEDSEEVLIVLRKYFTFDELKDVAKQLGITEAISERKKLLDAVRKTLKASEYTRKFEQATEALRIKDEASKLNCTVYEYLMYHSTCDSLRTLIGIFEINDRQGYDTDNYESFLDYAVDVIERKVI